MTTSIFTESVVEQAALAWLGNLGYLIIQGPEIAPGELFAERTDYGQVVLEERLRQALYRLNPEEPSMTRWRPTTARLRFSAITHFG